MGTVGYTRPKEHKELVSMIDKELVTFISQVGFPIVVCLYLLYERSKFNERMVETMKEITTVLRERLPGLSGGK